MTMEAGTSLRMQKWEWGYRFFCAEIAVQDGHKGAMHYAPFWGVLSHASLGLPLQGLGLFLFNWTVAMTSQERSRSIVTAFATSDSAANAESNPSRGS